jgi:large subunit ribosomal protein L10
MPSLVNRLVVSELARELASAQGLLLLSFGGLTVKESEALRVQMAAKGVKVRLLRNSLARRVLAERGLRIAEGVISGNTALAWGKAEAAVHAAKIVSAPEIRKSGKVRVRAGVLEGQLLTDKDAAALSEIPDRSTLNSMILGCISGPSRGLVMTLNGLPSGLVRVLNARAQRLETQSGADAPAAGAEAPA